MNVEGKTDKQLRRMCVNHWKRMLKLTVEDIRNGQEEPTSDNCAFCEKYNKLYSGGLCAGCPIYGATEQYTCFGTPFNKANDLYYGISEEVGSIDIKAFHKAVQKEIDFLESLEC